MIPLPFLASAAPSSDLDRFAHALQARDSATAVLESWCGERHFSEAPKVTARLVERADKAPPADIARALAAGPGERVRFRRVELVCGGRVLSRADNWYLPARLAPEVNRLLDETDTPFGKAVGPQNFRRRTLASQAWPDRATPIRNRAVLVTLDGRPFSEVVESYTDEVLASGPRP